MILPDNRGRQAGRAARLLSGLAAPARRLVLAADGGRYELVAAGTPAPLAVATTALVEAMIARDWLTGDDEGGGLVATQSGLAWLRRHFSPDDPWRAQHLALEAGTVEDADGTRVRTTLVLNESPLAWLASRRGADGRRLVTPTQLAAGERLRADFERGRLGPRVTVDWTQGRAGRDRRAAAGPADLLDSAIAARRRVEAALRALGPDLGSLLLDVCCFLTGLEDAERNRGWPRRSAKVVLSIALDRLADHYGLGEQAVGPASSNGIVHWGETDYRPSIDAG